MRITREHKSLCGQIMLPASKSISNRLLIMRFLYGESMALGNLSRADDPLLLSSSLDLIRQYCLKGSHGLLRLDARNAGTVMRFLTALLSTIHGQFLLTASERMKQRPVGGLVNALRDIGADIEYLEKIGYPPLLIKGRALSGNRVTVDAGVSSQFISALMLIAPALEEGLLIELREKPASWPYIQMTASILLKAGIKVLTEQHQIRVFPGIITQTHIEVEPDWSAASFWYSMMAMADEGDIFLYGLRKSGLQGDQHASVVFRDFGVETLLEDNGIRITRNEPLKDFIRADFHDFPDLALPVILTSAATGVRGKFTGLDRLRIKESDRLSVITSELLKIGITLQESAEGEYSWSGSLREPCDLFVSDADDHRVAMTFACLAIKGFAINIEQPEVVNKSYPGFWKDLISTGFIIH